MNDSQRNDNFRDERYFSYAVQSLGVYNVYLIYKVNVIIIAEVFFQ